MGFDQTIEIISATVGATIYYTTDGSNPSQSSNIYVTPLTVSSPVTIKAVVYKFGWAYSETKERLYLIFNQNCLQYILVAGYMIPLYM